MAEKISTLILEVELECKKCNKKIRKLLCKLQDRENIQSVEYNEKENKVKISGPFDPKKLSMKLRCKACKVIKDIKIELPPKPKPDPKPPPKPDDPKPQPKPDEPKPPPKPTVWLYPCPYPYPYPYRYPYPTVCGCRGWCNCESSAKPPPLPPPPPPPVPTCNAPCYDGCKTCRFICEDEPSFCSIM